MAGIKAVQGTTTINAEGQPGFTYPQIGLGLGTEVVFSLVSVSHASISWDPAVIGDVDLVVDEAGTTARLTPLQAGNVIIVAHGLNSQGVVEATYSLPLAIQDIAPTKYAGPLQFFVGALSGVETPGIGRILFADSEHEGRIRAKAPDGSASYVPEMVAAAWWDSDGTTNAAVGCSVSKEEYETGKYNLVFASDVVRDASKCIWFVYQRNVGGFPTAEWSEDGSMLVIATSDVQEQEYDAEAFIIVIQL